MFSWGECETPEISLHSLICASLPWSWLYIFWCGVLCVYVCVCGFETPEGCYVGDVRSESGILEVSFGLWIESRLPEFHMDIDKVCLGVLRYAHQLTQETPKIGLWSLMCIYYLQGGSGGILNLILFWRNFWSHLWWFWIIWADLVWSKSIWVTWYIAWGYLCSVWYYWSDWMFLEAGDIDLSLLCIILYGSEILFGGSHSRNLVWSHLACCMWSPELILVA